MASNTPTQGSVQTNGGPAQGQMPKPQEAQAQAGARLQLYHSDRALDMLQYHRVGSIEEKHRRTQAVAADIARVNRSVPRGAGGVPSSVVSGSPAPGQPIRDAMGLLGVGSQFES